MTTQLAHVVRMFEEASRRLHTAAARLTLEQAAKRRDPHRWLEAGLKDAQGLGVMVRTSEGLPLDKVRMASPFDARVRYNLYSAFVLIPRHQLRHIVHAEELWP